MFIIADINRCHSRSLATYNKMRAWRFRYNVKSIQ